MSTLVAQTISNGTISTSTANVINGAKAWVNFNGGNGGTAGAIRASYNVSSITVNGTGDYFVNFTNSMIDSNYSVAGSARYGDGGGSATMRVLVISSGGTLANDMATNRVRVVTAYANGGIDDNNVVCVQIFR
jgi:hypothetical protein